MRNFAYLFFIRISLCMMDSSGQQPAAQRAACAAIRTCRQPIVLPTRGERLDCTSAQATMGCLNARNTALAG